MAKLIKAATARKRSDAVDHVEEMLGSISNYISHVSGNGQYSVEQFVRRELADEVIDRLRAAGYNVEEQPTWAVEPITNTKKGFFARLFDKSDYDPAVPYLTYNDPFTQVVVSWAPDEEVQAA